MKTNQKITLMILTVLIGMLAFPHTVSAAPSSDDRTVIGESYTLENGRILDGDLNVIGGVVEIKETATVNGNVFVLGGLVTIDGNIKGDLTAIGGTVNLSETAVVEGDLVSPVSYINIDPDARILGQQIEADAVRGIGIEKFSNFKPQLFRPRAFAAMPILTQIGKFLISTLVLVALGALLLLIMPKPADRMVNAIAYQPWHLLGFGALTTAVMISVLFLSITICLIPFVILVGMVYALAILVGWLALGYLLGKRIASGLFNTTWHPVLAAALGNFVLYLVAWGVGRIPCFGWIPVFITMLFGLGMVIATLFGTYPYPRTTDKDEEEAQVVLFSKEAGQEVITPTHADPKNVKVVLEEPLNKEEHGQPIVVDQVEITPEIPIAEVVAKPEVPIEILNLSARINSMLIDAGILTVNDVLTQLELGDEALLEINGFGENYLGELKQALLTSGYKLP